MKLIALALLPLGALLCLAQNNDSPKDRVDELPQPWKEPIHRITFEEYDATSSGCWMTRASPKRRGGNKSC